jgi:hypothetical protein
LLDRKTGFSHFRKPNEPKDAFMRGWIQSLKLFGYVVVLLMLVAGLYAAFISVKYWAGIGV